MIDKNFVIFHLGNLFGFLAFWPRNILHLRVLSVLSMVLFIIYDATAQDQPAWNAIFWAVPTLVINVYMIILLWIDLRDHSIPEEVRPLFSRIKVLTPGQFRKLLAISGRETRPNLPLLVEGQKPGSLYYLLSGEAVVLKAGVEHVLAKGCFLGEIAFLNNSVATATVHLREGASCLMWSWPELKKLMASDDVMDIALRGLFNHDLSSKLAVSVPIVPATAAVPKPAALAAAPVRKSRSARRG
jgi:hypothetical protein